MRTRRVAVRHDTIKTSELVAMRHVIFGGDGFVGRHLAPETCCRWRGSHRRRHRQERSRRITATVRFIQLRRHRSGSVAAVPLQGRRRRLQSVGQDAVADPGARQAPRFLLAGELFTAPRTSSRRWTRPAPPRLVHFTTDMVYGHTVTVPQTEEHPTAPLGEYG